MAGIAGLAQAKSSYMRICHIFENCDMVLALITVRDSQAFGLALAWIAIAIGTIGWTVLHLTTLRTWKLDLSVTAQIFPARASSTPPFAAEPTSRSEKPGWSKSAGRCMMPSIRAA